VHDVAEATWEGEDEVGFEEYYENPRHRASTAE
jgi:hypothetical protein